MKYIPIIWISFVYFFPLGIAGIEKENQNYNHIKLNISLKVSSIEVVRKQLLDFVDQEGGYLKSFNNQSMILVFPKQIGKEHLIQMLQKYGSIRSLNFKTIDYSEKIIRLKAKIKTKENYFKELNSLTQKANLIQTLDMEKEISKIIRDLEQLRGNYNYYMDLISGIEVKIQFMTFGSKRWVQIKAPGWVSKIGIYNFTEAFHEK